MVSGENKEGKYKLAMKVSEILPNNERVIEKKLRKAKEEEEKKAKEEEEELRKKQEELLSAELAKKDEEAKRRILEEQRNMEKDTLQTIKAIEQGEGNMNELLKSIYRNISTFEINFAGIEFIRLRFFQFNDNNER